MFLLRDYKVDEVDNSDMKNTVKYLAEIKVSSV